MRHFFFDDQPFIAPFSTAASDCAITDVAIHVEGSGTNREDFVTYCGVSACGVPSSGNLSALLDFLPPAGPCGNEAGGAAANGAPPNAPNWDGIVGRLSRRQTTSAGSPLPASTPATRVFHSIVGGQGQDGLFGIAEIDWDRFVVVGSTSFPPASSHTGGSTLSFPFTSPATTSTAVGCIGLEPAFCVGTVTAFNAAPTRSAQRLALIVSSPIGSAIATTQAMPATMTVARDVAVVSAFQQTLVGLSVEDIIHVVGSTNDANLLTIHAAIPGFQPLIAAGQDGFVLSGFIDLPTTSVVFRQGSFRGALGDDGLVGVAAWNEYPDHVAVFGFSDTPGSGANFDVASIFIDSTVFSPFLGTVMRLMRDLNIGGSATETPAAMGTVQAYSSSTFQEFGLGAPAGGGICMDPRGRVTVAGSTDSPGIPVSSAPFMVGRSSLGGTDAVRVEVDMLPALVGRTDGTGTRAGTGGNPLQPAPMPPNPFTGGTTPTCALTPFGRRPGGPIPALARILVDCEAPPFGPTPSTNVIVDRPPDNTTLIGSVIQLGLPSSSPGLQFDMEVWLFNSPVSVLFVPTPGAAFRWPLFVVPQPPFKFSVQFACLLSSPLGCGNATIFAATAAMGFDL